MLEIRTWLDFPPEKITNHEEFVSFFKVSKDLKIDQIINLVSTLDKLGFSGRVVKVNRLESLLFEDRHQTLVKRGKVML